MDLRYKINIAVDNDDISSYQYLLVECQSAIDDLSIGLIAAESERDELKAKLAEIEKQEPVARIRYRRNIHDTNGEMLSFVGDFIGDRSRYKDGSFIYTSQPIANNSERITEQDALDILKARDENPLTVYDKWLPKLLAKLNEHREPAVDNCSCSYAAFESYVSRMYKGADSDEWHDAPVNEVFKDGFKAGLKVTANKTEVPDGWKLVPIEPTDLMLDAAWEIETECHNHGKIPDVSFLGELKAKECWKIMLEHSPLPPLKDGE